PWFEFAPGTIACGHQVPRERVEDFHLWLQHQMREHGLKWRVLTCKRGEAFIWHGGLVHGGQAIKNPERTRKSFVVHYSTAAHYKSRTARMRVRDNGGWRVVTGTTQSVAERPGARGLEAPLHE